MKQDEILEIARKAGALFNEENGTPRARAMVIERLERFAALVAAKAAEDERAACASLCEEREDYRGEHACAILERGAP